MVVGNVEFYFLLPMDKTRTDVVTGVKTTANQSLPQRSRRIDRKSLDETKKGSSAKPPSRHVQVLQRAPLLNSNNNGDRLVAGETTISVEDLAKPSISYACLIAEAINSVSERKLTLSSIYKYITDRYPYFRFSKSGWQNSIRHNLSLNKAFRKVPRDGTEPGKGMYWALEPQYAHLVDGTLGTSGAKRTHGIRTMTKVGLRDDGGGSAPSTPPISRQSAIAGSFVPILPTRPVSASPMLAPQLVEAANTLEFAETPEWQHEHVDT